MTLPADLAALLADLRPAAERAARLHARRRRISTAIAALAAVAVVAGVAVAAVAVLGKPAPKAVQAQIHSAAAASLADHPSLVVRTARVVAEATDATLYGISDKQGNYCIELLGAKRGLNYGFSCAEAVGNASGGQVDTPVTSIVTNGVEPPVVHFGQVPTGIVAARAVYPNGATEKITLGTNGFFVYEPSPANQRQARRGPLTIQLVNRSGGTLSYQLAPAQPVSSLGTHYQHLSGHVVIDGAAKVKLTISDTSGRHNRQTTVYLPISSSGTFSWQPRRPLAITQQPVLWVVDDRNRPLTNIIQVITEPRWRGLIASATAR